MTAADIMNMPEEKKILIEEILNSTPSKGMISYCIRWKYMKVKSSTEIVWDALKIFQMSVEDMKRLAEKIKQQI